MPENINDPLLMCKKNNASLFLIWIVFFSYATCAAILFQKLILPQVPALHGGMGLLIGDAGVFHRAALGLANQINSVGWQAWSAWPGVHTGNVAVLGALYAFFGADPLLVLPLNAAMHACCGILIVACGWRLTESRAGRAASIFAGTLFVVFPSALNWYAQLHKDNYSNVGYLLVFHAILLIVGGGKWRDWIRGFVQVLLGMAMIAFVRPQYIPMLLLLLGTATATVALSYAITWSRENSRLLLNRLGVFIAALLMVWGFGKLVGSSEQFSKKIRNLDEAIANESIGSGDTQDFDFSWHSSDWLPDVIDKRLASIAGIRAGMLFYAKESAAGSTLDPEVTMQDAVDVLAYVPRAILNAVAAPFPTTWLTFRSATRLVGVLEIAVWYLLMPGLLVFFVRQPTTGALAVLVATVAVLALLGLMNTNLGTLHRIRYPFLMMLMLFGALGWGRLLKRWIPSRSFEGSSRVDQAAKTEACVVAMQTSPEATAQYGRTQLVRTGAWVLAISLIGLAGLFFRDLIMARVFGLGTSLDAVQIGSVLPTFFAALLFVPLTNAVTPELVRLLATGKSVADYWIRGVIGGALIAALLAIAFCLLLWWLQGRSGLHPPGATAVFALSLIILALSGWVTVGNAVLNVNGLQRMAALGQILVPWPPILLLLVIGETGGAVMVATGMVFGQGLNLLFVIRKAKALGFHLWPRFGQWPVIPRDTIWSYLSIVGTSFLFGATVPLGTWLAMQLGAGHAGAFVLGYKMLSLTYAVVSALTTAVVVPYFSRHIMSGDAWRAKHGLAKLLHVSLLVSVPAAAVLFGFADQFVTILFGGGRFSAEDARTVATVVQFASVQLPFMISNLLIVRFAEVSSRASQALIVTILAQVVTVLLALYGLGRLGVAGVALASSVGVIVATVLFLFLLIRNGVLSWLDAGLSLIGWWLFLTLCICLYFSSFVGVGVTCIAFLLVVVIELLPAWRRVPDNEQELAGLM